MITNKILNYYKQTSLYTDLGLYKEFAKKLPNDIRELCLLQRHQIIHPFDMKDTEMRNSSNSFYGDMTTLKETSLCFENDLYPTAISMIAELLRRNKNYTKDRAIEDKIHVCCREQAILLAAILKAKGIPARVRSGFASYVCLDEGAGDHWITEYYNKEKSSWILVDADMYFDNETLTEYGVDFDLVDIPREKFIFGAEAYLKIRNKEIATDAIYYSSTPRKYGLKGALHALFYDFHSLMNDEIIFLHLPKYIVDKNFELNEEEYIELDNLAKLMLDPDTNFEKLVEIWNTNSKFRIMTGGMN